VRTRRNAIDWQNDLRVGERNVLTTGILLTRENAVTVDRFGSGFDVDTDVDMVFAQDRFDFGRHNLLAAVAWYDHETFGTQFPWNLDYGLDIGRNARVIASIGSAFRAPDATDRFGFGGNPDLEPEVSRNHEIAFQQRLGAHELGVAAFRNDIEDLVDFVVLDPETFEIQNRNIERARIEGVELSYGYVAESWRLRTEASLQNPRNLSEDTRLLRRARESFTASFVKSLPRSEVGLDLLVTGSREDFGGVRLDGYTLVNLTGRFYLTSSWSLQARLENVLDEQYALASNFNTADRGLYVSSRIQF
jgi:vitamin B12 transporter